MVATYLNCIKQVFEIKQLLTQTGYSYVTNKRLTLKELSIYSTCILYTLINMMLLFTCGCSFYTLKL